MDKLMTMFQKKERSANLEDLWQQGLPNIARFCIWPILIGNSLHITKWTYESMQLQVQVIRNKLQVSSHVSSDKKKY